jgi:hypothetical protein
MFFQVVREGILLLINNIHTKINQLHAGESHAK